LSEAILSLDLRRPADRGSNANSHLNLWSRLGLTRRRSSNQDGAQMARSTEYLLEQIERAKRLAAALYNQADRERFEKIAADYQKEIDDAAAASGDQQPSSATGTTFTPVSEAAPPAAVASESESAPTSIDDQQETKD
jgi:hypothetical protein